MLILSNKPKLKSTVLLMSILYKLSVSKGDNSYKLSVSKGDNSYKLFVSKGDNLINQRVKEHNY